ncbi:transcriptional regulator with XRE-family HTH domain [Arthrobacter sp. CAN_A214]
MADIVRGVMQVRKLSRADIAAELGRSPRMVSKLLNGESRGESFRTALVSLRDNGTVDRRPPRRRNKNDQLVPVRAKIDREHPPVATQDGEKVKAPTVVPEDTDGRYVTKVPNRFSEKSSYSKDGNRVHQVTMSKTNKSSRERGMKAIMGKLVGVARTQSHKDKKVTFTATLDNGRQVIIGEKGGTYVSQALRSIKAAGGIEQWTNVVMAAMYEGKGNKPGNHQITGLRMNVTEYQTQDGLARYSRKKEGR